MREGRYQEAEAAFRAAVQAATNARARSISLTDLAGALQARADWDGAEPLLREALELQRQVSGPDHPEYAVVLNNLGALAHSRGRMSEAETTYRVALAILEKHSSSTRDLVSTMVNLGAILKHKKQFDESERLHLRAIDEAEKWLGPKDLTLAFALNGLSLVYKAEGKLGRAEAALSRALEIRESQLGPDHPLLITTRSNLGDLYLSQSRFAEARKTLELSVASCERQHGPEHLFCAGPLNNLAQAVQANGDRERAEALLQRAIAIWQRAGADSAPQAALAMHNLGALYVASARWKDAEQWLNQALKAIEKNFGPHDPHFAAALATMGDLNLAREKHKDAAPFYERAYAIRLQALGAGSHALAQDLVNLGIVAQHRKRFDESEKLLRQALELLERPSANMLLRATALGNLSQVLVRTKRVREAAGYYERALKDWERAMGPNHPDLIPMLELYAGIMRLLEETAEANKAETRALGIKVRNSLQPGRN